MYDKNFIDDVCSLLFYILSDYYEYFHAYNFFKELRILLLGFSNSSQNLFDLQWVSSYQFDKFREYISVKITAIVFKSFNKPKLT